ncbi:hypothetical protein JCM19301_1459 [Jejuia pallidilutea]|uniref:Uncharacterized protein n=1 Tax=Jejuia pallidilutea TaxID=504487 RepID=A0A090VQA1_9FLAO|nr:hypothetical protein JCM19301_1459 [Jejuia pallidilutea]
MYSNKNAYALSDTLKVNERCSHCNTKYRIEPSFFTAQCTLVMQWGLHLVLPLL